MKRGKMILFTFILLFVFLFLIRLYIDNDTIKTTKYQINSSKIPSTFDGYKILQLSDLHNKNFEKRLFDKIELEKPDIIVMTGDMVSSNSLDFFNFLSLAQKLAEKYPVYYIKGNHEGRLSEEDYKVIDDALKIYGVKVLDNEKIVLEKENKHLNLYGMWCNQRYYSRADADVNYILKKDTVTKLLGKPNTHEYNVLLMHTPTYFDAYASWGADLVLSGHIHGGMIRLPFAGGIFSPDRKLFPKYCYGKYSLGNSTMIISSGLNKGEAGFRFFNQPEIVVVTLKNEK